MVLQDVNALAFVEILKNEKKMKKIKLFIVILVIAIFTGCSYGNKYDKLILTDQNTGKQYLLRYNIGDTYFISEKVIKIIGNDTICVFEIMGN